VVDHAAGIAGLDGDVVRRAVAGDRAALGELWAALNPALVRFLTSLGVVEPDDLAAAVWVELARRMPKVEPDPIALRTLLLTIGRRRAIDAHRRSTRRSETLVAELDTEMPVDDGTGAVDDAVVARALLDQLPRAQREVVNLRFVVGLTPAEVGKVTGQREGAVRVMTLRGLRRLRELAAAAGLGPVAAATDDSLVAGPSKPGTEPGRVSKPGHVTQPAA
jgi:RNA polymerase sigma-70 factor (ECF subfamily)